MSDIVGWISDVFSLQIGTLGTVNVTLGLILAGALVIGLATQFFRRVRGRG